MDRTTKRGGRGNGGGGKKKKTKHPPPPAVKTSRNETMIPRRTRYVTRNQTVLRNRKRRFHSCTENVSGLTERCDAAFLINSYAGPMEDAVPESNSGGRTFK